MDRAFLILTLFASSCLMGQDFGVEIRRAQALHDTYDFDKALEIWHSLLERSSDSLQRIDLLERIVRSENGRNMLSYATEPRVISSLTVPRDDFSWYSHLEKWQLFPTLLSRHHLSSRVYIHLFSRHKDIVFSSGTERFVESIRFRYSGARMGYPL